MLDNLILKSYVDFVINKSTIGMNWKGTWLWNIMKPKMHLFVKFARKKCFLIVLLSRSILKTSIKYDLYTKEQVPWVKRMTWKVILGVWLLFFPKRGKVKFFDWFIDWFVKYAKGVVQSIAILKRGIFFYFSILKGTWKMLLGVWLFFWQKTVIFIFC